MERQVTEETERTTEKESEKTTLPAGADGGEQETPPVRSDEDE